MQVFFNFQIWNLNWEYLQEYNQKLTLNTNCWITKAHDWVEFEVGPASENIAHNSLNIDVKAVFYKVWELLSQITSEKIYICFLIHIKSLKPPVS